MITDIENELEPLRKNREHLDRLSELLDDYFVEPGISFFLER
jgi:hypothetical protein